MITGTHIIYTIRPGDTLYSIASRFGSSVDMIEQANSLYPPITDPGLIFPGQNIVVPSSMFNRNQTLYVIQRGDTLYSIAQKYSTYTDVLAGLSPSIQNPNYIFPDQQVWIPALIYEVEAGDTLRSISTRFGITLATILHANQGRPGLSPDVIYPGFRLILPLPTSPNIVVFRPYPGEVIEDGVRVEGFARAFEGTVLHQLRDQNDVIISNERYTQAAYGAPTYAYFESSLPFDRQPTSPSGELWVYTRSAQDGSIQDLVQLKVYFAS